jgi:hypothetical protein
MIQERSPCPNVDETPNSKISMINSDSYKFQTDLLINQNTTAKKEENKNTEQK